jgi:NTE family protein
VEAGVSERVILVLGGGGMKGLAHVGAWRALAEADVVVSEIIGTSIGSLVGACVAGGMDADRLAVLARELKRARVATLNRWAVLLNGIRQPGVFRGELFRQYVEEVLPATDFGALRIPLAVNAVDLGSGADVWFGAGGRADVALADAVYASSALPVFYPPAEIDGRYYIDGGIGDALPIRRAAERGADRIIAIDVGSGGEVDAARTVAQGMVAVHHRVVQIMGGRRKRAQLEAWSGPELLYVRPSLDGYSTFDFASTDYFLEEGYRATRAALSGATTSRAHTPAG